MPRAISFAAAAVWLVSFVLMLRRVEPFYTQFYSIAWWCYILLLAVRNERRVGASLLTFPSMFRNPAAYGALILFSAAVWFFFELYNARLHNWAYIGVPVERWIRWPGYFVAFGTVLPGLFETARWLEGWLPVAGLGRGEGRGEEKVKSLASGVVWGGFVAKSAATLGFLCMFLPLLSPRWFFPAIWVGLIFLLDPLVERTGEANLLVNFFSGERRRPVLLICSGVVCGFFWEFWNYWSGAKWIYTLPYFHFAKIFEMPLLGYLGFPPFALECWLLYGVARHGWRESGVGGRIALIALVAAVCLAGIYAVDHVTVRGYRVTRSGPGR